METKGEEEEPKESEETAVMVSARRDVAEMGSLLG